MGALASSSKAGAEARSVHPVGLSPALAQRWPKAVPASEPGRLSCPAGCAPRLASFVLRPGQWTLKIAREEARAIFSPGGSGPSQFLGQQIWARAVAGEGFTFQGLHPSWVSSPPIDRGVSQP